MVSPAIFYLNTDAPLVIIQSLWKVTATSVLIAACGWIAFELGYQIIMVGEYNLYKTIAGVLLCSLGAIGYFYAVTMLFLRLTKPDWFSLTITSEGFTIKNIGIKKTHLWHHISKFSILSAISQPGKKTLNVLSYIQMCVSFLPGVITKICSQTNCKRVVFHDESRPCSHTLLNLNMEAITVHCQTPICLKSHNLKP